VNACTLVLHHSQKYDIVKDEADSPVEGKVTAYGQEHDVLGEYRVLTSEGEETRSKILLDDPDPESVTTIEIPEGYEDTPTALTQLAEMLLDRHAPGEAVTGLHSPDNAAFGRRVAALMGVEYLTKKEVSA
jgi:hypothetical protein